MKRMDALTTPLPKAWQKVRLGDICEITTGSLDANEMVHYGKYRFYTCAKECNYLASSKLLNFLMLTF